MRLEKASKPGFGIHWFRRDLRLAGNPALLWNCQQNQGRVVGLFSFDSQFLSRADFSANRFGFFLNTLKALKKEMKAQGGDLLVLDAEPRLAFSGLLKHWEQSGNPLPTHVTWNRDYEPYARERDSKVQMLLSGEYGITCHIERDHLILEPNEVLKDPQKGPVGGPKKSSSYQVYSPFAKRWFATLQTTEMKSRVSQQSEIPALKLQWADLLSKVPAKLNLNDALEEFIKKNQPTVKVPLPPAGHAAALKQLDDFKNRLKVYQTDRDFPAIHGTSGLSIYLKNGSITAAQIVEELGLLKCKFQQETGPSRFLKEIVWREFYYSILYHHPRVEHEAFLTKFKSITWENDKTLFKAWCEGKTGFPIVDAGMRQLNQTGWMHNRMRMVVASFLVKDLLIDWRWGENYFMKMLLDGDLAPNNGGWQWAASTGCDPQPYFRIFNPLLQSKKFDPEGVYIRKFVSELSSLRSREIHDPPEALRRAHGYPNPVVHHAARKIDALRLYSFNAV